MVQTTASLFKRDSTWFASRAATAPRLGDFVVNDANTESVGPRGKSHRAYTDGILFFPLRLLLCILLVSHLTSWIRLFVGSIVLVGICRLVLHSATTVLAWVRALSPIRQRLHSFVDPGPSFNPGSMDIEPYHGWYSSAMFSAPVSLSSAGSTTPTTQSCDERFRDPDNRLHPCDAATQAMLGCREHWQTSQQWGTMAQGDRIATIYAGRLNTRTKSSSPPGCLPLRPAGSYTL